MNDEHNPVPNLPEECEATIKHALIHQNWAIVSFHSANFEQLEHELYMVRTILLHMEKNNAPK